MKRVILDTNIIISSVLGGALVLILEKWDEKKFTVVVTIDVISEYFEVLNRPKFNLKQEAIDKITHYYGTGVFRLAEKLIKSRIDFAKFDMSALYLLFILYMLKN
jgi:predicted nucleic acid-binding protein